FADGDGVLLLIVLGLNLVGQGLYLDDVFELPNFRWSVRKTDRLSFTVTVDRDFLFRQDSIMVLLMEPHGDLAARIAMAAEFELEVDNVVDKHHFIDEQIGNFKVPQRILAAYPHGEYGNALASPVASGLTARLTCGR